MTEPAESTIGGTRRPTSIPVADAMNALVEERNRLRSMAEHLLSELAGLRFFYEQSTQVDQSGRDLTLGHVLAVIRKCGKELYGDDFDEEGADGR